LGERFNLAFAEVVEMLLMFPEVGRELGEHSVRRMNLRNFSYHLIYRAEGDYLVIYAIAHHKQRPGYWTDRLK
jgi:plasmid stabilization system protein ParE